MVIDEEANETECVNASHISTFAELKQEKIFVIT